MTLAEGDQGVVGPSLVGQRSDWYRLEWDWYFPPSLCRDSTSSLLADTTLTGQIKATGFGASRALTSAATPTLTREEATREDSASAPMVIAFFASGVGNHGGGDMVTGVQDVYYEVENMNRALAFYRDVLGLPLVGETEHWSAFNVGGLRLGLHSTEGKPTTKRAVLTLKTSDIRADMTKLRTRGVGFLGEIEDHDWGSVVAFEDSEGNVLKLMRPRK